jgi:hypothetical protein
MPRTGANSVSYCAPGAAMWDVWRGGNNGLKGEDVCCPQMSIYIWIDLGHWALVQDKVSKEPHHMPLRQLQRKQRFLQVRTTPTSNTGWRTVAQATRTDGPIQDIGHQVAEKRSVCSLR